MDGRRQGRGLSAFLPRARTGQAGGHSGCLTDNMAWTTGCGPRSSSLSDAHAQERAQPVSPRPMEREQGTGGAVLEQGKMRARKEGPGKSPQRPWSGGDSREHRPGRPELREWRGHAQKAEHDTVQGAGNLRGEGPLGSRHVCACVHMCTGQPVYTLTGTSRRQRGQGSKPSSGAVGHGAQLGGETPGVGGSAPTEPQPPRSHGTPPPRLPEP